MDNLQKYQDRTNNRGTHGFPIKNSYISNVAKPILRCRQNPVERRSTICGEMGEIHEILL
jgi:hypothetical protein